MGPRPISLAERLWRHIEKRDGHWLWTGASGPYGYGRIQMNHGGQRRSTPAHRVMYELIVEPIPDGFELDHLCFVPACVNPAHLEPVTREENNRRRRPQELKTHCVHGHEYTPENTFWMKNGFRWCLTCKRTSAREAARRARRKVNQ